METQSRCFLTFVLLLTLLPIREASEWKLGKRLLWRDRIRLLPIREASEWKLLFHDKNSCKLIICYNGRLTNFLGKLVN
jgi:hypothetical protein